MGPPDRLFEANRARARQALLLDPTHFQALARGQSPEFLWIGCSDSRVSPSQILGLPAGELFVHRNVANLVPPDDVNILAVLQYAIEHLRVRHLIVCGHHDCGGVKAAWAGKKLGLLDGWLRPIRALAVRHEPVLRAIPDETERVDRLAMWNVIEQVGNLARTSFIREAWTCGQPLAVHGWFYRLREGLLEDLNVTVTSTEEVATILEAASSRR